LEDIDAEHGASIYDHSTAVFAQEQSHMGNALVTSAQTLPLPPQPLLSGTSNMLMSNLDVEATDIPQEVLETEVINDAQEQEEEKSKTS
jgi:thiamine phosphate synthase YjbQ (UPF0047 family)